MAILITQDRQVANLTPLKEKSDNRQRQIKSRFRPVRRIPFRESNEELDLPPLPQRKTD